MPPRHDEERDEVESAPSEEPTTGLMALAPAIGFIAILAILIVIGLLQR